MLGTSLGAPWLMVATLFSADSAQRDHHHAERACPVCSSASHVAQALRAAGQARDAQVGASQSDVLHYDLNLEIFPAAEELAGDNVMTVRAAADGVSSFAFWLHDAFEIVSVQVNGAPAAWRRIDSAVIEVTLDRTYDEDEQFVISVAYEGQPVAGGLGSIEFDTQDGQPLVFTLSEPWFAYTWWPVKEDNRDKAAADLRFTVPEALTVASNGMLQSVTPVGSNRQRHHWKTDYPTAPYLFAFSAANYNEFTDTWIYAAPEGTIEMPLLYMIFPSSDNAANREAWLETKTMLTVFSDLFGVYPFAEEKYGIYQFDPSGASAMEHQTMSGQDGFESWLSAHELAHQWWGNLVTCADWHHIWLNEGFASYSEALWEQYKPGSSGEPELHAHMQWRRPNDVGVTVYRPDDSNVSSIFRTDAVYRKGSWVLHMLRHVIGDLAFFQSLHEYRERHAHGAVVTEDFQAAVEAVVGRDMTWFFQQWVYDPGAPEYHFAWQHVQVGESDYLEIYLQQAQSSDYPVFSMPIDLAVTVGSDELIRTIWNDEQAEHLLVQLPGPPQDVQLDPDEWILREQTVETSFVQGPPKIASLSPGPGSEWDGRSPIQITFHKPVSASADDFLLQTVCGDPIDFDFTYHAQAQQTVLTPLGPAPAAAVELQVLDSITELAADLALDGEVLHSADPQSLPSGDGLPGGSAVFQLHVAGAVLADLTCDGVVDVSDLLALISNWGSCPGGSICTGDINGDGAVDVSDLLMLLANWG